MMRFDESHHDLICLLESDLFGKPVSTFRMLTEAVPSGNFCQLQVFLSHEAAAGGSECALWLGSSWRPEQYWFQHRHKRKPTIQIIRFACTPTAVKATTSTVPTRRWLNATQQHQAAGPNAKSIPLRRVHMRGAPADALSDDNGLDVRQPEKGTRRA